MLGNDTDAEASPLSTILVDGTTNGTQALNGDGGFTYTPSANFNGKDSFTYRASDGLDSSATTTVELTVLAVNDVPTLIATTAGNVAEDGPLTATGTIAVTDADGLTESRALAVASAVTKYGSYTVDAGSWAYTSGNGAAVQALPAGQTLTDTFTFFSQDKSASQAVAITITGANDPATFSGSRSLLVSATTGQVAPTVRTGTFSVNDVDTGETGLQLPGSAAGKYGAFSVRALSSSLYEYTYSLDNTDPDTIALGGSQSATETFTVASLDGTSTTITVTVRGANDPPTITGTRTGTVSDTTGTTTSTVTGTLTVTDPDPGESKFSSAIVLPAPGYGSFTMTTAGAWTYSLNNTSAATNALKSGETVIQTITVYSVDMQASETIAITVLGVNDGPTGLGFTPDPAAVDAPGSMGTFSATGDPDGPDSAYAWSIASAPAGVSIDATTGKLSWATAGVSGAATVSVLDGTVTTSAGFTISIGTAAANGTALARFGGASSGNDIVVGLGGNDVLAAGDGSNYILGGSGDDDILGGAGADFLYGGDGADRLAGGGASSIAGNILDGGAGDDVFDNSVAGLDTVTGGPGNDRFVYDTLGFTSARDSIYLPDGRASDIITDFAAGDLLDLSSLGLADTGALRTVKTGVAYTQSGSSIPNFFGTTAETRSAVALSNLSGGARHVFVDVNGDRTLSSADMMIRLGNGYALAGGDIKWS